MWKIKNYFLIKINIFTYLIYIKIILFTKNIVQFIYCDYYFTNF